jgi:hypothetical protein
MKGCINGKRWVVCFVIMACLRPWGASSQDIDKGQNINLDRYHNPIDQDRRINLDETDVRKDDDDEMKPKGRDEIFNTPEIFEENAGAFNFNLGPFAKNTLTSISSIDGPGPDPDAPIDNNIYWFLILAICYGVHKYKAVLHSSKKITART